MLDKQTIDELYQLTWPLDRLGEAMHYLARASGLLPYPLGKKIEEINDQPISQEKLDQWIDWGASQLGIEAEPMTATYAEIDHFLQHAAPALLLWPSFLSKRSPKQPPRFLVLVRARGQNLTLINAERAQQRVHRQTVRQLLCTQIEQNEQLWIDALLQNVQVPALRRQQTRQALLHEVAGDTVIQHAWSLRLTPAVDMRRQLTFLRLPRHLLTLLLCYLGQLLTVFLTWSMVNRMALSGASGTVWQWAWSLLLLSAIPLMVWANNAQNQLAVGVGQLFKQRLLFGALRLARDEVRHQGTGQFLGRVLEAELLEQLALTGGFTTLFALIQLSGAFVLLALGATSWLHVALLGLWVLVTFLGGWRFWRRRSLWIDAYRSMTNDLVERMVGHRTRLVQEDRQQWHLAEDQILDRYFTLSVGVDRADIFLKALVVRGWMLVGVVGLAYAWVWMPASPALILLSVGGILLALQSLTNLMAGMQSVIGALFAWQQVEPLFHSATRPLEIPAQEPLLQMLADQREQTAGENRQSVLLLRDLHFRYPERSLPILQGCNLQIQRGDRLLLEGPSGSGKSTLAALLGGLQKPDAGLLLLWGFDAKTLGSAWRQRVVTAPQFHENHVFSGTLAFNLLLGRRWPPHPADLVEAEQICRELGLGMLLDRMPAGLQQIVGESGWQLSHGERSRLFMARTLLQSADLIILDESFAALDPENLHLALHCILRRAPTLLVIAHP